MKCDICNKEPEGEAWFLWDSVVMGGKILIQGELDGNSYIMELAPDNVLANNTKRLSNICRRCLREVFKFE